MVEPYLSSAFSCSKPGLQHSQAPEHAPRHYKIMACTPNRCAPDSRRDERDGAAGSGWCATALRVLRSSADPCARWDLLLCSVVTLAWVWSRCVLPGAYAVGHQQAAAAGGRQAVSAAACTKGGPRSAVRLFGVGRRLYMCNSAGARSRKARDLRAAPRRSGPSRASNDARTTPNQAGPASLLVCLLCTCLCAVRAGREPSGLRDDQPSIAAACCVLGPGGMVLVPVCTMQAQTLSACRTFFRTWD